MFLFDDDDLGTFKKRAALRVPPPVPDTGWTPPREFPNLTNAAVISLDTETKELDFDRGPGWARGQGHIVGVSLAARDRSGHQGKWYFPVRHEVEAHDNLDPSAVFGWLKTQLETPHIPKIGANLLYDAGWLTEEGIEVQGDLHDVQFAEALLTEAGLVNLDHLGQKYLGIGKESNLMYQWIREAYAPSETKIRGEIYRTPPRLVGHYAEDDADLPMRVLDKQWPLLWNNGLFPVYRMECDSIPLLTAMRRTGVRIDLDNAERLYDELAIDVQALHTRMYEMTGMHVNVDSGADLAKLFDSVGIKYRTTAKGAPSFTADYLKMIEHPVAQLVRDIREIKKIRSTFIRSYILESNVNGRIHCQFHPLRGDDGGTRSGRYSSDKPNLQNIPIRSDLGKRIRALFLMDKGHLCWEKNDYSQIEYRMLAHFAVGEGSDRVRQQYREDPDTDYHKLTQGLVKEVTGLHIERKPIKNINFGLLYGMGEPKLARQAGIPKSEAKQVFQGYHAGNPYVKATMDAAADEARTNGFVTTILERRSYFELFEPRQINYEKRATPLPYDLALRNYGIDIQVAHTHKAINRKLQGSAADIIKKGMVQCWKEGVYRVIGVPKLQVHDETDHSVKDDSKEQREAYAYMRHVLETAIPLRVPVLVESGRGLNWGEID